MNTVESSQGENGGGPPSDGVSQRQANVRDLLLSIASGSGSALPVATVMISLMPNGEIIRTAMQIEPEQIDIFIIEALALVEALRQFAKQERHSKRKLAEVIKLRNRS